MVCLDGYYYYFFVLMNQRIKPCTIIFSASVIKAYVEDHVNSFKTLMEKTLLEPSNVFLRWLRAPQLGGTTNIPCSQRPHITQRHHPHAKVLPHLLRQRECC